jgi:hypothetical protein
MVSISQIKWLKGLWLFFAFLIFNYSIDAPDPLGDSFKEDLSVNDIESITELILEQVFDLDNIVLEHDEDDPDEKSAFAKKIDIQNTGRYIQYSEFEGFRNYIPHYHVYQECNPSFLLVEDLTDPPEA